MVAGHAPSARVIDLSFATILPGLIDCHAHVLGNLKDYSPTGARDKRGATEHERPKSLQIDQRGCNNAGQ
jgi:imidazolonepropionase-like amidohydrolase